MPIHAQEESAMHAYLGTMQTIASPYSVHDGDTFADIPDLPPVDLLALPGSILPISLTARFAKDNLLRASVACPPLLRIGCLQQRQDGSDIIDEIDMLCAVEKLSHRPQGLERPTPIHAILRVICPCDLVASVEQFSSNGCLQHGGLKKIVRARDSSRSIFNAQLARLNALRFSVPVKAARIGATAIRSLGISVMNEQLIGLCDVAARLETAANRAKQVFGHVPALSSDPLSVIWQLLSLCCLPQLERVAALTSSATFFSLMDLLLRRLDSSKLFCRSCYTHVCDYADFCAVSSASAVSTFINPAQVIFEVVTVQTANVRSGRFTSEEASWFPGFRWSYATCRHCEAHLGVSLCVRAWILRACDTSSEGWAYSGLSNGQPCSFLGLCVSHLAHQPPPVAELLAELHASGTLSSDGVAQILEIYPPNVPPYAALHRILASNLRLPVSERDRLLLVQLDGNFRFGQNGLHHQDLSGIQMHHEVESVGDDEGMLEGAADMPEIAPADDMTLYSEEDEDSYHSAHGAPINGSGDSSDAECDCDSDSVDHQHFADPPP